MLDWLTIIILLVVGISLIVTELIFIPGTTIFGIIGLALAIIGVVLAFVNHGTGTGLAVLSITFIAAIATVAISLRTGTWDKMSLKGTHTSKVNEDTKNSIWKGDTGKTVSSLRPSGKAEFNNVIVEVTTYGQYISAGKRVRVIDVQDNRILVEQIEEPNKL